MFFFDLSAESVLRRLLVGSLGVILATTAGNSESAAIGKDRARAGAAPEFAKGSSDYEDALWSSLGPACDGNITSIAIGDAGEVYLGGLFWYCGDTLASNVVRYDPTTRTWSGLGTGGGVGVDGGVDALAVYQGDLYVGGTIMNANQYGTRVPVCYIARWDGASWSAVGGLDCHGDVHVAGSVKAMLVAEDHLYIAGDFTEDTIGANVPAENIVRWNGVQWSSVGSNGGNGVDSIVNALAYSNGNLYAGGWFRNANVGAPIAANHIARWDGAQWSAVGSGGGNGVDYHVHALATSRDGLYVGGNFTKANYGADVSTLFIARWTGTRWEPLGNGGGNGIGGIVLSLAAAGNDLFVGGYFFAVNIGNNLAANSIARWNGRNWAALGSGVDDDVKALKVTRTGSMYVVGSFLEAGGMPISHAARYSFRDPSYVHDDGFEDSP